MKKLNKFCISFAIVITFGVVIGVTSYKVITDHNTKVALVEEKYIVEQAKKCFYDKKCNSDKATLQELYDNDYLDKPVNRVTKEYYNSASYVIKNGNDFEFIKL